jgi:DNA-directed RNA polymerase subunit RPC12/RpoP
MKYGCKKCGKTFQHPSQRTEYNYFDISGFDHDIKDTLTHYICPFCESQEYTETLNNEEMVKTGQHKP